MNKITRITRKLMFKDNPATKIQHVRVHNPSFFQSLITQIVQMFQQQTAHHKPNQMTWIAKFGIQSERKTSLSFSSIKSTNIGRTILLVFLDFSGQAQKLGRKL